ncbi:Protein kinase-like protein [Cordyceps javanica]|uniref:Protein kinase-like protein n=1 Tax=Cordyceps javanica TaxID=43265 RepID=A0A545VF14_9HYPO|nr:Protein kinase-like protein [Cordyceps javanica]TQW11510.1 Protein kinase-like protein [Cordyceps javanica]
MRAVKVSGTDGPQSVILKHGRPYFDDDGHLQPFSIERQRVEASMISLWDKGGPLAQDAACDLAWRLPKVLRHDRGSEADLRLSDSSEESSILLIEDLGHVLRLHNAIQGWCREPNCEKAIERVSRIGSILGHSLATLHSQETARAVKAHAELSKVVSQNLTADAVWYLVMEPLPNYLRGSPKGEEYFQRLVEDIQRPKFDYPQCLMHGDFNFGNVVIQNPDADDDDDHRPVAIDWEFATSQGRGVNGDNSEFISLLHCILIGARKREPSYAELIRVLCRSFCSAYRDKAALPCTMTRDDLNTQLYRSAMLVTGRDMINFANDNCDDDAAFDEMVDVGLWYLEHAGHDMDEFVEWNNQQELTREDEGLVRSMFIFS